MTDETTARIPDESFRDWCKRRGYSIAKGYAMIRDGIAPRTIKIGRKRTVPATADAEWEAKYCKESTIDPDESKSARVRRRGG
jgi:hypothetical protein